MRRQKQITLIATLLLGGVISPHLANAANEQQRLQQLRSNITELRQGIGTDKQQQSQLQKDLKRLERIVADTNIKLRNTEEKLTQQRQAQRQLENEALSLSHKLDQQKQLLSQQLRASFTPTEQQTLKLLLNQSSPAETSRNLTYYSYFSRAQQQTITLTRNNIEKLHVTNEELQKGSDKLEALKQQQQDEQNKLAARRAEQKTLIAKLDSRIQGNQQSLATMLADERGLTNLLQELEAKRVLEEKRAKERSREKEVPAPSKIKGKLQWPLQGKIKHSFGDPRNQGRMTWQGLMISGKEGQEIHAIASGKVVFADWMRGYGLLLIIDHGNGLMSLYGHNQQLHKKTGDTAGSNEVIATLGSSDNGEEAGLYFELRHKGKPVDPEKWLR